MLRFFSPSLPHLLFASKKDQERNKLPSNEIINRRFVKKMNPEVCTEGIQEKEAQHFPIEGCRAEKCN